MARIKDIIKSTFKVLILVIIVNYLILLIFKINPFFELKRTFICVGEGEFGVAMRHKCCDGLKAVTNYGVKNPGAEDYFERCGPSLASIFMCTKCGNGICEKVENECNCEEDCFK